MKCNLLHLPTELQLQVIKELLGDDDQKENEEEPTKVFHDLINWSCTCSFFRGLIAPYIFKTCKLVNQEKSGSSLNAVANGPHNIHVKELYFMGPAFGNANSEQAAPTDTEGIFPRSVDALLCDLQRFPSLEKLSIDFGSSYVGTRGINLLRLDETETQEQVLKAESSSAWRALMSRTYSALTQNKSPNFKHLDVTWVNWINVSTFSHASFHKFLGHLEQFTLLFPGNSRFEDNSLLSKKLDENFYNRLVNVTALNIKGPLAIPTGAYSHVTPNADRMPLLTTLHLDCIFASLELSDFLVGHKDTLEELTLRKNCYASIQPFEGYLPGGIHWSELFTSLFSAQPAHLRRFELVGNTTRAPSEEDISEEEKKGDQEIQSILQQDPRRIFFSYAAIDSLGLLRYNKKDSLKEFWKGEDQKSWDQLMGLVKGNASEAAKSKRKAVEWKVRSQIEEVTE